MTMVALPSAKFRKPLPLSFYCRGFTLEQFGKCCALLLSMIALLVLLGVGAGALLFMLTFLKAMGRELRLRGGSSRIHQLRVDQRRMDQRREPSWTLVMLERYRNDRAA